MIQIFTYGASATPQATVSASVGSYATRALNALIGGSAGPLRLSLQAAALASDGFNAASNPAAFNYNPDADGYRSGNATVDLALPLADGHELAAKYLYNRQDAQYDGSAGFDDRTVTTLETWQLASRNRLAPFWTSRLTAGQSSDDSVSQDRVRGLPVRHPADAARLAERLHAAAGSAHRRLRIPQGNGQHRRRVRGDLARHELGVRDLPVARRRAGAPGQPALGRFVAVRRQGDRGAGLRLPGAAVAAPDRRGVDRLQAAVVQRPLLPRLQHAGPGSPRPRSTSRPARTGPAPSRAARSARARSPIAMPSTS